MNEIPAKIIILGFIPETFLMVWVGLQLLEIKTSFPRILGIAIVQGISIYYFRKHLDFGGVVFFQLTALVLYTRLIAGVRWLAAILAVVLSSVIVILIEGCFLILFHGNGLDYIWWTGWIGILIFIPYDLCLLWILYICRKRGISLLAEFAWLGPWVK